MAEQRAWKVTSPDGRLTIRTMLGVGGRLWYDVTRDDGARSVTAVGRSVLGLVLDAGDATRGFELEHVGDERTIDETYELVAGKRRTNHHAARERTLRFRTVDGVRVDLVVRAADDGVAFRYRLPDLASGWTVEREATSFALPSGRSWIAPYDHVSTWGPAYETLFSHGEPVGRSPVVAGKQYPGWQFPALFSVESLWVLVTESDLDAGYCACHLTIGDDGSYEIAFPSDEEALGQGTAAPCGTGPLETPWRVIVVSPDLAGIVETSLVTDLARECQVPDVSWIRPGRSSWSWWSDFDSSTDHDALRAFIDLAADMGWEYSTVDANWHTMADGDVERLLRHAEERGVRLLLWFNSGGPTNDVPEGPRGRLNDRDTRVETFSSLADRGVAGLKVDFFDSDKQLVIGQYLDQLADAADHELLLNFHGSTIPRGWQRTWPNCITMEAVRGGEQYRLDTAWPREAPRYNTILPFTRNAIGSMDYTPVAFAGPGITRVTTDAHELALCVVYETGMLTIAGAVEAIRALPDVARDFLRDVPVVWDETRFVSGAPGELAVIARRAGTEWWFAGISGVDHPLPLAVDLSFLDDGDHVVMLITDSGDGSGLRHTRRVTDRGQLVNLRLLAAGGFVARVVPLGEVHDTPAPDLAPRAF